MSTRNACLISNFLGSNPETDFPYWGIGSQHDRTNILNILRATIFGKLFYNLGLHMFKLSQNTVFSGMLFFFFSFLCFRKIIRN